MLFNKYVYDVNEERKLIHIMDHEMKRSKMKEFWITWNEWNRKRRALKIELIGIHRTGQNYMLSSFM